MHDRDVFPENDPGGHTVTLKNLLGQAARQARVGADRANDQKARALLETTAEILKGLVSSFEHFENTRNGCAGTKDGLSRIGDPTRPHHG